MEQANRIKRSAMKGIDFEVALTDIEQARRLKENELEFFRSLLF